MKRSAPLRRTEFSRRTPLVSGGWLGRGRSTLRPVSARRQRVRRNAQPVVDAVMARDGGCVLRGHRDLAGTCFGPMTPHHLRKQSHGGGWTSDGLVTLCSHHNGWVEDHPVQAWGVGLVVLAGETTRQAWASMRTAQLAAGRQAMPCPASGMAPEATPVDGRAVCQGCGRPVALAPEPTGWGGAVLEQHDREVL